MSQAASEILESRQQVLEETVFVRRPPCDQEHGMNTEVAAVVMLSADYAPKTDLACEVVRSQQRCQMNGNTDSERPMVPK